MCKYHVVCRTCATEGTADRHEAIVDGDRFAEYIAELHEAAHPGHDVGAAEVA